VLSDVGVWSLRVVGWGSWRCAWTGCTSTPSGTTCSPTAWHGGAAPAAGRRMAAQDRQRVFNLKVW